jgi:hypothetical protein
MDIAQNADAGHGCATKTESARKGQKAKLRLKGRVYLPTNTRAAD